MNMKFIHTGVVGLLLTGALGASAQQMTAAKVVFKNAGAYAQTDLERAAGVHAGQKLTLKDIQAAAQRLADTGCFEDVHVDSAGVASALTVIFLLKPAVGGDLHPVRFDNFVWFTPQELQATVRGSAPLYTAEGQLPEISNVLDGVSAALQAALASKGFPHAEVSHELVLASSARPLTTIEFRVNKPAVTIHSLSVQGVPAALAPEVQRIAAKLRGTSFTDREANGSTFDALLRPLLDAGYLEAHLADEKVEAGAESNGIVSLDVHATVEPGDVYHVGAVTFAATSVVSAQAFAAGAKLQPGALASRSALLASEETVDLAYRKLGYMDAYVDPGIHADSGSHTVTYALQPVPGAVYHLHAIDVQGLSPEARAQFDQAWQPRPGDPYNPDYVRRFLTDNTATRKLSGYAGSFQAAADPATHQVDLTVSFVQVPAGNAGR